MKYIIYSLVSLKGSPYRKTGDKIGGEKTGVNEEDSWGIIGEINIDNDVEFTTGLVVEIAGNGLEKTMRVIEEPAIEKTNNNYYRIIKFDEVKLFINEDEIPVVRVIPLSLEMKKRMAS